MVDEGQRSDLDGSRRPGDTDTQDWGDADRPANTRPEDHWRKEDFGTVSQPVAAPRLVPHDGPRPTAPVPPTPHKESE